MIIYDDEYHEYQEEVQEDKVEKESMKTYYVSDEDTL